MCDCHGASRRDLLPEQRDHAAVASQYIPKTDCHKLCGVVTVVGLYDHLTDPLARTHDIGGVHRLVRGDQHELLHTVLHCRLRCLPCAEDIVLDRLIRTHLHQGHMLVCSRMIDDIRPVFLHDVIDAVRVPHRGDQHDQIKFGIFVLQLLLDLIGIVLIDIHDDQARRSVSCDLAAELASDRAASPRHHDGLSLYII